MSGDILTFPEDATGSASEYIALERAVNNQVIRTRKNAGDLKVIATGGSAETKLSDHMASFVPNTGVSTIAGKKSFSASGFTVNGAAAAAGTMDVLVARKTGIANNTATAVITVTVPNAEHNAAIFLDMLGHLGAGTDTSESSRCATGAIVLARTTGVATVATAATLTTAQIATVSGGGTLTLAYGVSSITGAVGVTQTFDITVTLVVTGTITDHTVVVSARLLNSIGTGVTMAAA